MLRINYDQRGSCKQNVHSGVDVITGHRIECSLESSSLNESKKHLFVEKKIASQNTKLSAIVNIGNDVNKQRLIFQNKCKDITKIIACIIL